MTVDREQTRRDERIRRWTDNKLYGDGHDARVKVGDLRSLKAELEQAERRLDAAMQYVPPKDRAWIEEIP